MDKEFKFKGIIPANLLPFNRDYSINEKNYRRHMSWLADVPGVTAIVCNGHAAEVSSLTRDERRKALAVALDEVGDRVPLIAGIYTDGTLEAGDPGQGRQSGGGRRPADLSPHFF